MDGRERPALRATFSRWEKEELTTIRRHESLMSNMQFQIPSADNAARRGRITFARGTIETPAFMPVGTYGSVKAMTPQSLKDTGAEIILEGQPRQGELKQFGVGGHMGALLCRLDQFRRHPAGKACVLGRAKQADRPRLLKHQTVAGVGDPLLACGCRCATYGHLGISIC